MGNYRIVIEGLGSHSANPALRGPGFADWEAYILAWRLHKGGHQLRRAVFITEPDTPNEEVERLL